MYNKQDPETIQQMFASIAKNYDEANQKVSFGLHKIWNKALIKKINNHKPKKLLDLCAGTGAIAFSFLENNIEAKAILLDFCEEMLNVAKIRGSTYKNRFETITSDAQNIPLPNDHVDAISIAYGIRNVKSPLKCFKEAHRVLKPNGLFAILELTRPSNPLLSKLHNFYLKNFLPLLGKKAAHNKEAYTYLSQSITQFASPPTLAEDLKLAAFSEIKIFPLLFGTASLITSKKNLNG